LYGSDAFAVIRGFRNGFAGKGRQDIPRESRFGLVHPPSACNRRDPDGDKRISINLFCHETFASADAFFKKYIRIVRLTYIITERALQRCYKFGAKNKKGADFFRTLRVLLMIFRFDPLYRRTIRQSPSAFPIITDLPFIASFLRGQRPFATNRAYLT
jgi:hypothetical protein